jgi:hypothetical protein
VGTIPTVEELLDIRYAFRLTVGSVEVVLVLGIPLVVEVDGRVETGSVGGPRVVVVEQRTAT